MKREELIASLEQIRKAICAYGGSSRCDCKFMEPGEAPKRSESGNGCCEIRTTIWMIERMTPEEFERFTARTPHPLPTSFVWCVRWLKPSPGGWCATLGGQPPTEEASSDLTACGAAVIMRVGSEKRTPTCKECLELCGLRKVVEKSTPATAPVTSGTSRPASGRSSSKAKTRASMSRAKKRVGPSGR